MRGETASPHFILCAVVFMRGSGPAEVPAHANGPHPSTGPSEKRYPIRSYRKSECSNLTLHVGHPTPCLVWWHDRGRRHAQGLRSALVRRLCSRIAPPWEGGEKVPRHSSVEMCPRHWNGIRIYSSGHRLCVEGLGGYRLCSCLPKGMDPLTSGCCTVQSEAKQHSFIRHYCCLQE